MYHPAYGWLQDDHIYQRIIGWRGPMQRWVGKLDCLFEKPGNRSASGGWQGNMSMSLRSFFKAAWNHLLRGSWSGGESYLFSNYLQAVTVGWTYVEEHNGWRYVPGGEEGAMARLQQALAAPDLLGAQTGGGPDPWEIIKNSTDLLLRMGLHMADAFSIAGNVTELLLLAQTLHLKVFFTY
jgi:hypothetical protein